MPGLYGEAEFIEKRSRFIGRVWRVESEEEALAHIADMRKQHWDATHNVYAYCVRDGATRFSDDGEPSGTSGLPTLDVFRKGGVYSFCCVITRYFGGILLGGGGLVRAYGKTASLALEAAGLYAMRELVKMQLHCPYPLFERVKLETERWGEIENAEYGADVLISALLPGADADEFAAKIIDMTNGQIYPEKMGSMLRPVRIEKK